MPLDHLLDRLINFFTSLRLTVVCLTPEGKVREVRYWNPGSDPLESVLK